MIKTGNKECWNAHYLMSEGRHKESAAPADQEEEYAF
jgi:hypothetical protein